MTPEVSYTDEGVITGRWRSSRNAGGATPLSGTVLLTFAGDNLAW
jgi:hypothetical protein